MSWAAPDSAKPPLLSVSSIMSKDAHCTLIFQMMNLKHVEFWLVCIITKTKTALHLVEFLKPLYMIASYSLTLSDMCIISWTFSFQDIQSFKNGVYCDAHSFYQTGLNNFHSSSMLKLCGLENFNLKFWL